RAGTRRRCRRRQIGGSRLRNGARAARSSAYRRQLRRHRDRGAHRRTRRPVAARCVPAGGRGQSDRQLQTHRACRCRREGAPPAGADGERGIIVSTASVAAYEGQIGKAAYSASKGGIVALTLPAARELARYGIRVVAIAPGIFSTPMLQGPPQNVRDSFAASIPFPSRLGRAEEYAALVLHLCRNMMINGEVIRSNGRLPLAA